MIVKNDHIKNISISTIQRAFIGDVFDGKGDAYYRPVQTLFNMVDYAIWGLKPFGYHLTNLVFHIISAFLLFLIFGRVFNNERIGHLAACFFVVHPIVVEQLIIIAGRAELMSLTFLLASIFFALYKTRRQTILSWIFFGLSCLSKESGIITPAFLLLIGFVNKKYHLPLRSYIPFAAIGVAYLFIRHQAVGGFMPPLPFSEGIIFLIRDLPAITVQYLATLFFPMDLHSHRRMAFNIALMWVYPLVPVLLVAWALLKKSNVIWFLLAWFFIGLLPKMPVLATNSLMIDHWAYVSGISIELALALILARVSKKNGNAVTGIILAFWISLSWWSIWNRKTDKENYLWAVKYPSSSIVRSNLGLIYYLEGNYLKALELFEVSLRMNSDSPSTKNNKALCLWKLGHPREAIKILDDVLVNHPNHGQSQRNRAFILGSSQRN